MATPLETLFFNNKKIMPQCDGEIPAAKTLVIQFDQEKFEQLLSEGGSTPTSARKHIKISMARSPLTIAWKQVPDETEKTVYWLDSSPTETELA